MDVANFLQCNAHDHRAGLVADEALPRERPKLALRGVPHWLGYRLAHATVREPDARRIDFGHSLRRGFPRCGLAVVHHAERDFVVDFPRERRILDPLETGLMAVKLALFQVVHLVRRDPLALVVAVE